MLVLKIVLLVVATWRFYRLVAMDTGSKCMLRKFRIKLDVKYVEEWTKWTTKDGSLAEMITNGGYLC